MRDCATRDSEHREGGSNRCPDESRRREWQHGNQAVTDGDPGDREDAEAERQEPSERHPDAPPPGAYREQRKGEVEADKKDGGDRQGDAN